MSLNPHAVTAIHELRQACRCLYLEVPESVAHAVHEKAEAVIAELEAISGTTLSAHEPDNNPHHT